MSVVAAIFFTAGAWRRRRVYFWQFAKINFLDTLDMDDDGELSQAELLEYEEGGQLTRKVVDRVWQMNLANRGRNMDYWDWVIFVMADVDKSMSPALDYWFAVLDTDGDGLLSLGEMKEFYSESLLLLITADCNVPHIVHWEDIITQIIDTVNCDRKGTFSLMDISRSHKFPHILDAFINIFSFIINDESDVCIKSDML